MSDLIQRLRTSHNDGLPGGCQGCQDSLCEEAAAEIERLRGILSVYTSSEGGLGIFTVHEWPEDGEEW